MCPGLHFGQVTDLSAHFHAALGQTGRLPVGFVSHLSETLTPLLNMLFGAAGKSTLTTEVEGQRINICLLDRAALSNTNST